MILDIMHMKVSPRKKMGCVCCDFFHGMEDENLFCLLQELEIRKGFEIYREPENYKMLQGAMHLLREPCEIISCAEGSKN